MSKRERLAIKADRKRRDGPHPVSDWIGTLDDHRSRMAVQQLAKRLRSVTASLRHEGTEHGLSARTLEGWATLHDNQDEAIELLNYLVEHRYLVPNKDDRYSLNPEWI